MRPSHLIILLLMNLCWAGVYSAYKVIGNDVPTGAIVTLRFGLGGILLLLAWPCYPGQGPRGKDLGISILMGLVLFVLGQRLQVYGNQLGTAGNSSVLMALEPLVTSVAAALFLKERIGPRRLVGFVLGLAGVAVLNRVWRSDFQFVGLAASLIFVSSFICEAAYSVLGKPLTGRVSILKMVAISMLVGSGVNLLIDGRSTLAAARGLSPTAWLLLVALAVVCTAIGYTFWFVVIRECPVNVAALTVFSQTLFGVGFAALWLGEKLHWGHLFGSLTIVFGLVLGLSRQIKGRREQNTV